MNVLIAGVLTFYVVLAMVVMYALCKGAAAGEIDPRDDQKD